MTARAWLLLMFAALAALAPPATAWAQNRGCEVVQAPGLDFGRPAANPTAAADTTTTVTVRCTGNGSEANTPVLVCIGLYPTPGQTATRQMGSGAARLNYQIHRDSYAGPAVGLNQASAVGVLTMSGGSQSRPAGETTVTLYGLIAPGQSGLAPGLYTESIRSELRTTTTLAAGCGNATWQADFQLAAQAELASSCAVVADDLAFGVHSSLAAGITGTTALGLTCTTNTSYTVRLDGGGSGDPGDRRMRRNGVGPQSIGYDLYQDSAHTQPWGDTPSTSLSGVGTGSPVTLPVHGLVPGGQPAPAVGAYEDTVTVTVEY